MPDELMLRKDEPMEIIEAPVTRLGAAQPEGTIELATRMATTLADIVEKRRLYAVIQGKKYPQVEAWMTIARMDNVVAREAEPPIRHDDGSYEAFVELIRLSDGLVIGRGSALCGTEGDNPWVKRPEPARRSMAVTRATSRAFRQQYSWIMALAGYEPTPADEMPQDNPKDVTPRRGSGFVSDTPFQGNHAVFVAPDGTMQDPIADGRKAFGKPHPAFTAHVDADHADKDPGGFIGIVEVGRSRDSDFQLRKEGDDEHFFLGFKLKGNGGYKVITRDELALQLLDVKDEVVGKRVQVWGNVSTVEPGPTDKWRAFQVIAADRIKTEAGTLPVNPDVIPVAEGQVPAFDLSDEALA